MDEREFRNEVKLHYPGRQTLVDKAFTIAGEYLKKPYYYPADVSKAIQLVGRLEPVIAELGKKQENLFPDLADSLLTSDFLVDKIKSWAELVRVEIFNSQDPPFASLEDMEVWIQAQVNAQPKPTSWPPKMHSLEFLRHNGKRGNAMITEPAPPDWSNPQWRGDTRKFTALNWLENETRIMSKATGFLQLSLVQFVLMGTKPILPRYHVGGITNYHKLPSGEKMRPTHVTLDIWARDLKFDELQKMYNSYRYILGLKRGKSLKEEHLDIVQLVSQKGEPPRGKGVVAFWESVKAEWNKKYPDREYQTWKGIKKRYDSIIAILERRISGKEGTK